MIELGDKTLVMLVSPSAMGKSTIVHQMLARDTRFRRVRGFTTRSARPNDEPRQFFYFTPDEVAAKRDAGEVITEVTFPGSQRTYGTIAESFSGDYCVLETLANSVEQYRSTGFGRTVTISLTTHAASWRARFLERYPKPTETALQRVDEARLSIQWSLSQTTGHAWLINDSSPESVARRLIDIVTTNSPGDSGAPVARQCLDAIDTLY
jgi:guanylate kinase